MKIPVLVYDAFSDTGGYADENGLIWVEEEADLIQIGAVFAFGDWMLAHYKVPEKYNRDIRDEWVFT